MASGKGPLAISSHDGRLRQRDKERERKKKRERERERETETENGECYKLAFITNPPIYCSNNKPTPEIMTLIYSKGQSLHDPVTFSSSRLSTLLHCGIVD
jgi:hypothetical protein